jgi:hypothetical protein
MKVLWNARILYNAKPKDTYEFENGKWKMENGWIGELLCCVLLVLVCWCVGLETNILTNKTTIPQSRSNPPSIIDNLIHQFLR